MVIQLEEPESPKLLVIPVGLSFDGSIVLTNTFFLMVYNPVLTFLIPPTGLFFLSSWKVGFLDTCFFFRDSSSPEYCEAATRPMLAIAWSFSAMTQPLPLPQEASSAQAGLVQGLILAQEAGSAKAGFPGVFTMDFKVCWGIDRASPAAGLHTCFQGSRIS